MAFVSSVTGGAFVPPSFLHGFRPPANRLRALDCLFVADPSFVSTSHDQGLLPFPAGKVSLVMTTSLRSSRRCNANRWIRFISWFLQSEFGVCARKKFLLWNQMEKCPAVGEEASKRDSRSEEVRHDVAVLKTAAKTRKVPPKEVFAAVRRLETAKVDPSNFLQTIGGTKSPGRTWMLIFVANAKLVRESLNGGEGGGQYFPVTAVQRFDAAAMKIENGIYLGPIGFLILDGRFSWKQRVLAFLFESLNLKIGSLRPFKFSIVKKEVKKRIPGTKDPFFIWSYADDEIIVARGRGGGLAFWCRCRRIP